MGYGKGVGDSLATVALIIINIIFFLCGGAVLACGIIALVSPTIITNLFNLIPNYQYLDYYINVTQAVLNNGILLTCIGSVIVLLSIMGCIGPCVSNFVTLLYAVFVLVLLLFEIAVVMWAAIDKQLIESRVADLMFSSLQTNFQPIQSISSSGISYSNTTSGLAWESLQFKYSCCGARNYTDYQKFSWNQTINVNGVPLNATVPPSCCLQSTLGYLPTSSASFVNLTNCLVGPLSSLLGRYQTGCYVAIVDQLSQYTYITTLIIASLIAVEIIVIMLAMAARKPSKVSAV